jgi:hypothetical protein
MVVAAALAGAAVAPLASAAPASAAPSLTVELSPASVDMKGGDTRSLTVKLTNAGPPARVTLTAAAPGDLSGDVTLASSDSACSGSGSTVGCTVDVPADAQKSVVFTLAAKNPDSLGAGQSRTDSSGAVTAAGPLASTKLSYTVTLHGPPQSPTQSSSGSTRSSSGSSGSRSGSAGVTEVSGTVLDAGTNQPVPAATVVLLDGAGRSLQANTDSSGGFVFASSSGQQIAPGTLTVGASRDPYGASTTRTVQAQAGQTYSGIQLPLTLVAGAAQPNPSDSAGYGGLGSGHRAAGDATITWLIVGAGVLLVLAGGGILAVLFLRRRTVGRLRQVGQVGQPSAYADTSAAVSAVDPWERG